MENKTDAKKDVSKFLKVETTPDDRVIDELLRVNDNSKTLDEFDRQAQELVERFLDEIKGG